MKSLHILTFMLLLVLVYSCQNDLLSYQDHSRYDGKDFGVPKTDADSLDGIKIAVISDIHLMHPSLLVKDGPAFQAYLAKDPKLLKYTYRLFQATVDKMIEQRPDLVLIPGDLTKDGELIDHETVARLLRQLTIHGIKVVITVGNHDINNPEAMRFIGDKTVPVPTVQADRIPFIYADFGFRNAISRDPNSLSYVCEPIKGLWIIAIDANMYYDNNNVSSVTKGKIKPETLNWIETQLAKATSKNKLVIAMMHHGLIEHFTGQEQIDPGYVIEDWQHVSDRLIDDGLKVILTGHYHANDITYREHNGKRVYDVETGSLGQYPCTYRMLTIYGNHFTFEKQNTTALMGGWFDEYARTFITEKLVGYFTYLLTAKFGIQQPYASALAPYFQTAGMAHIAGDEYNPNLPGLIDYLNDVDSTYTLSSIVGSLWTDINTPDNNVTIDF
ncbi:MAG: metallophosphoesterase [Bacteroidota bacterium]|nr:metallophosphoesterase [Bacteroidota bacterium]